MQARRYLTSGDIRITREIHSRAYQPADTALAERLDEHRGVLFSSSFEFPGRYTRWDMGFVDPPLALTARGRGFAIEALNQRGRVLMGAIAPVVLDLPAAAISEAGPERITGEIC